MYFRLSEFYRRDISFVYSVHENPINWLEIRSGKKINCDKPLIFKVDKIDNYLESYDILPTIGIPLISSNFKSIFYDLVDLEIELIPAIIIDKNGNKNEKFFALNILQVIKCLDKEKSIFDYEVDEEDGFESYTIQKYFIESNALSSSSIVRMKEHDSFIIVTEKFKQRCENANLKGIGFLPEGHTIYSNI